MIGVWDEFGMNLTDSRTEDASKGDEDKYWESGVAVERKEIHIPQPGSRQGFLSEFGWQRKTRRWGQLQIQFESTKEEIDSFDYPHPVARIRLNLAVAVRAAAPVQGPTLVYCLDIGQQEEVK